MSPGRRVAAALSATVLTVLTAWLSRVPLELDAGTHARLRLSWRLDGVAVEECRTRTQEELEALPVHMRNPGACIGRIAPYSLDLDVDGRPALRDTVRAGGAREDRPVHVLRELALGAGAHRVSVRFAALVPEGFEPGERALIHRWDGEVSPRARDVLLFTLEGDSLLLRLPGDPVP